MKNQFPNCENQQQSTSVDPCLKTSNKQVSQYKQKKCENMPQSQHSDEKNQSFISYSIKSDRTLTNNTHYKGIEKEEDNFPNKTQKIEKIPTNSLSLIPQNDTTQTTKPSQILLYQPYLIQQKQKQSQQQPQKYLYYCQCQQSASNMKETFQQSAQKKQSAHKFKTEICKNWIEYGMCNYGKKCQFAHGKHDLNVQNKNTSRHYKSKFCKKFHTTNVCAYGPRCLFIHENRSLYEIKQFRFFQKRLNDLCQECPVFVNDKNQIPSRLLFFQALGDHSSLIL